MEGKKNVQKTTGNEIVIERPVFSQVKFENDYAPQPKSDPITYFVKNGTRRLKCSGNCVVKLLHAVFPFVGIMKNYKLREDLIGDIISGLTVGIVHIPQGMAYGMLTTLDPIYGLYSSFFPVIIYFFFGSSRHISMGTNPIVCLMLGFAIQRGLQSSNVRVVSNCSNVTGVVQDNSTFMNKTRLSSECSSNIAEMKLEMALAVTIVIGLIQFVMGIFRLGFVVTYLSDPLISGFTTGAAVHVFTSQIVHIFGVETGRYNGPLNLIYKYRDFFNNIATTNYITVITSSVCIIILYTVKEYINNNHQIKARLKMPVPIELIIVIVGTIISYLTDFNGEFKLAIVGDVPTGLPVPTVPNLSLIPDVISSAFAISIVGYAITVSMAKILAKKHDYEIDSNQELIAQSLTNIGISFFSAFASGASMSRSLIQEHAGGRTQLTGLISCLLVLLVLLLIGPYFETLPKCILASIIIVALKGMFKQALELKRFWRVSKYDFIVWTISFWATVILDVDYGLLVGVISALLTVLYRDQRPCACVLGRISDTDIYVDVTVYKDAKEITDIKIFRFENAVFFMNVENFKTTLLKHTCDPRHVKMMLEKRKSKIKKSKETQPEENFQINDKMHTLPDGEHMHIESFDMVTSNTDKGPNFHTLILDCSAWSFIDSMGIQALKSVVKDFKEIGVHTCLAFCKSDVSQTLHDDAFFDILNKDNLYMTINDAVFEAQKRSPQCKDLIERL